MVNLSWKKSKLLFLAIVNLELKKPYFYQIRWLVNYSSAQQLVFVKQKKFGKKTFIGFTIALFLVVATSLGFFFYHLSSIIRFLIQHYFWKCIKGIFWGIVQAIFSDIWAYKNDTLSGIFWNKVLEL